MRIASLVAGRLGSLIALVPEERAFLEALEAGTLTFRRHDVIAAEGDKAEFAYVLKRGWTGTSTDLPDGSRQMRRLHLPGDLVGVPSLVMHHHAENIVALSDATVSPFGKDRLGALFDRFPRLGALMFMISQFERITLGDRLSCIGRLPAIARLAYLLVDILQRLRAVDPGVTTSFVLQLTREEMADMVGITPVHVSRKWTELEREGLIRSDGRLVTILDERRLRDMGLFVERARDFDLGCLPDPVG